MNTLNLIELDSIDTRDKIFISIGLYYTQKGEIVPQYIECEDDEAILSFIVKMTETEEAA